MPCVPIVFGTDHHFAELNRQRIARKRHEFICFAMNPTTHASDKLTIRENLQSLGYLENTIVKHFGCKAVVSPITLGPRANYRLSMYDKGGVTIEHVEIPKYKWANPAYELVHASIVACHQNLLSSLQGTSEAETTGQDNLRTLQLVDSAYRSAKERQTIEIVSEQLTNTTAVR